MGSQVLRLGPRSGCAAPVRLLDCVMLATQWAVPDAISPYTGSGPAKLLIMIGVGVMVYVLPTMLAWSRRSNRRWRITAVNLLLGWTVIGWFTAIIMTFAYEPPLPGAEPDRERIPGSPRPR